MVFSLGVGSVGKLFLRSAAPPGGWSSYLGHCEARRLLRRAAQLRKTLQELGRSFHGLARLVLAFLGYRPFLRAGGVWCCSAGV